jgi:hypothetical protein
MKIVEMEMEKLEAELVDREIETPLVTDRR